MTTTHVIGEHSTSARTWAALAGLAAAMVIVVVGNTDLKAGENGGTGPLFITGIACVLATALIFGYLLPRAQNANRAALIYGVLGVLSLPIFWSGLSPIFAAAALAERSEARPASRPATVATVGACVVATAAVLITIAGRI